MGRVWGFFSACFLRETLKRAKPRILQLLGTLLNWGFCPFAGAKLVFDPSKFIIQYEHRKFSISYCVTCFGALQQEEIMMITKARNENKFVQRGQTGQLAAQ